MAIVGAMTLARRTMEVTRIQDVNNTPDTGQD